jgi:N-methylhydantoinase B
LSERNKIPPWGLNEGKQGALGEFFLLGSDGTRRKLNSKSSFGMTRGDILIIRTPAGGGFGNPCERDPQLVLRDVLYGFVSTEAANQEYGVAVDLSSKEIDWKSTGRLRRGNQQEREKW